MAAIRKTLAPRPGSELKAWRAKQAQELLRLGIRPDGSTRIVTREDGSSPKPKGITEAVSDFMKARGSAVRLHGLRHSHASHLLAENVHPKIMQERLGHHSISVTMHISLDAEHAGGSCRKTGCRTKGSQEASLRTNRNILGTIRAQIARQMVANGILAGEKARQLSGF